MTWRARALVLCSVALVGCLFFWDSIGVASHGSLRGGRSLQEVQYGGQVVDQGMQYGSHVANKGMEYGNHVASKGMEYGNHVANKGWEYGNNVVNGVRSNGWEYSNNVASKGWQYGNKLNEYNPYDRLNNAIPSWLRAMIPLLQVIFAVIYYCTVVSNYPYWNGPTPMSCQLQGEPAPCATTSTSPSNCCLSWCCPQARAAHTFDKTGTLEYWCGLLAMFLCPFCTLCYANACSDLNPKLGGEPANIVSSAACTWCCSCCVIAQDAESLDAATGAKTECCGVSGGMMPNGPYGYGGPMGPGMMGPGMMPGQMMMQPQW
jgi:hypothetical protein